MAKKLADIEEIIREKEKTFKLHLQSSLDNDVLVFLNTLSVNYNLYIFSGIIRNYFLHFSEYRDVDLIIDGDIKIENFIANYKYKRNSYGGYKITINETIIDLWFLKDTWALKYQATLDFELVKFIPNTAFFNFSSIIFSYSENKFFYTKYFTRFLRDKKIDFVFAPNANTPLCVVNSLYYSDKFKLNMTDKLKRYIKKVHKRNIGKYEEAQLKHFGKIQYTSEVIDNAISSY